MREWKKILHPDGNQKKAGGAILLSDKIHVKIKTVARDKEGHNIMIKGSIPKEDITIVNNRLVPNRKRSSSRLYMVTLLISLIFRVHHEKRWTGRNTSWIQYCREKY